MTEQHPAQGTPLPELVLAAVRAQCANPPDCSKYQSTTWTTSSKLLYVGRLLSHGFVGEGLSEA
eukprot:3703885-Amphidinium_carterae.1